MTKHLHYLFLIFVIFYSSCTTNSSREKDELSSFEINGTLTGFKDNTWIYLEDESNHNLIPTDSALISNGKFHFKGTISQKAVEVQLGTKESEDFRSFWLENSSITFNAKKGGFRNAIITGSKTQIEFDKLESKVLIFRKQAWHNRELLSKKLDPKRKIKLLKETDSLFKEELSTTKNFVKNNCNSIVSAYYLNFYASEFGKPFVTTYFSSFPNNIKNSSYGKDIAVFLKLNKDLKIGNHFADFEQKNPDGKIIKFSDYTGKLTLLEFWASWCGPCRKDNPELIKMYNKFKDKGLKILSVSADDKKSDWLKAIEQDKLPWPQVCDLKGDKNDVVLMYGVNKFPSNFLIDEKGIIIAQDLRGEDLKKKLLELLK